MCTWPPFESEGFRELGSGLFPDYHGRPGADLRGSKYSDLTRKSLEFESVNSLSVITYIVLTNKLFYLFIYFYFILFATLITKNIGKEEKKKKKLKDIPFIWVF